MVFVALRCQPLFQPTFYLKKKMVGTTIFFPLCLRFNKLAQSQHQRKTHMRVIVYNLANGWPLVNQEQNSVHTMTHARIMVKWFLRLEVFGICCSHPWKIPLVYLGWGSGQVDLEKRGRLRTISRDVNVLLEW